MIGGMRTWTPVTAVAAAAVLALAGGCGGDTSGAGGAGDTLDTTPSGMRSTIDHRYWPMDPGTRWTYREIDEEGRTLDVVVTVSSVTKRVAAGFTARVVRDTVSRDGEVLEDTRDWYGQDRQGNVWYLGEDTAEFDGGKVSSTEGSWEAGVAGARAGIVLPARPADGQLYRQEYAKGQAEDWGEVLAVDDQVEVPAGHWKQALLTRDTNALEPANVEHKLYAPGVGPALTLDVSGGAGREELLKITHVDAAAAEAAGTTPLGEPYT
jgi:hypothetical protein